MSVKRRIVWFSDPEWDQLGQAAKEAGLTISAYLKTQGWARAVGTVGHAAQRAVELDDGKPTHHMTQGERDAILRRVNRGG